jgi:hypothetical protein
MVNPRVVAVLYSVQDLEENALGRIVITNVLATFGYIVEQIPFGTELQDNINAVWNIDYLEHGHHVEVGRGQIMQSILRV